MSSRKVYCLSNPDDVRFVFIREFNGFVSIHRYLLNHRDSKDILFRDRLGLEHQILQGALLEPEFAREVWRRLVELGYSLSNWNPTPSQVDDDLVASRWRSKQA